LNGDNDQGTGHPIFKDWMAGFHRLRAGFFARAEKMDV
jgi:hypothetical protein